MMKIAGVVGGGTMGAGIAQVSAAAGFQVYLLDISEQFVKQGIGRIESFLKKGVARGKVTEAQMREVLSRIHGTTNMADLSDCDIVVEAVFEQLELKKKTHGELDKIVKPECILATNTSCLSVTEIAAATARPGKVIGLHFFNPVPLMRLVEVITALQTEEQTVQDATAFCHAIGKQTVRVKDFPGFLVNHLLIPYINRSIDVLDHGWATRDEIDTAAKLGLGHPMGPLELIDFDGLDVHHMTHEAMYTQTKDPKFAPPTLLTHMFKAGRFGKKSGKGFYEY